MDGVGHQRHFEYTVGTSGLAPTPDIVAASQRDGPGAYLDGACRLNNSGSLAKFVAMRRASSPVSRLVAERRTPTACPELMLWAAPPPAREHGYGRR